MRSAASLGRVSVVIIARANCAPPSRLSSISAMPASMRSIGRRRPITPVEPTSTSEGSTPRRAAASSAMRSASASPAAPVATLELPELTTSARATPRATRSRVSTRGAPTTALRVKSAAAVAGRSESSRPRSKRGSEP